jgi:hypothetical protein
VKKMRVYVVLVSLSLIVLYYFLRFQWGWDHNVLAMYALFLSGVSAVGLYVLIKGVGVSNSRLFVMLQVIFAYLLLLSCYTFVRGGGTGLMYAIKEMLLPALFGVGVAFWVSPEKYRNILLFISYIAAFVGVLYVYEFIKYFVNGDGYMNYSIGMRNLFFSLHQTGGAKMHTVIQSDNLSFIRLPGVLSHNNVTGLLLSIGALLSLSIRNIRYPVIGRVVFLICLCSLLLTMARSAMLSFVIGYAVLLYYNGIFWQRLRIFMVLSVLGVLVAVLLQVSGLSSQYNSAAFALLEPGRIINTLVWILSNITNIFDSGRFYNLIVGSGFSYPGYQSSQNIFGPLISDDLFFIQLLTMFGVIPFLSLLYLMFSRTDNLLRNIKASACDIYDINTIAVAAFSVIVVMLVSTIHTNAMSRAQLFPIFFICLAILSKYEIIFSTRKDNCYL